MSQTPAPIVGQLDTCGVHNTALLKGDPIYFMEGKSWKKQDTIILLPAAEMVPTKAAMSWMHLLTPPNQGCPKIALIGQEVGEAYSNALEFIRNTPDLAKCPYILTIEHDQIVPQDGLIRLLKAMDEHPEFGCIGGLYWTKGHMGVPQIWGDASDPILNYRPQRPDPAGGLVECCGTGMGFNLWRTKMLLDPRLPKPLFKTKCSATEGAGTQDLVAWGELRKLGYRCAIDCSCLVGHLDLTTGVVW